MDEARVNTAIEALKASEIYPARLATTRPSETTIRLVQEFRCSRICEIGAYEGATSLEILRVLGGEGYLHVYDYADVVEKVLLRAKELGYNNIRGFGNPRKLMESYNLSLRTTLCESQQPIYDYVFIDGAHTWETDALAFLLLDKLLMVGGIVEFDDAEWSLAISPTLRPDAFPLTELIYSDAQIQAKSVKDIIQLLVCRDARYKTVIPGRAYQKCWDITTFGPDRTGLP